MTRAAHWFVAVALIVACVAGQAEEPVGLARSGTDAGAAESWSARVRREVSWNCGGALAYALWHDREHAMSGGDCARHSIVVRNDSPAKIQCRAILEYREVDYSGRKLIERNSVVFENSQGEILVSWTSRSRHPIRHAVECVPIPLGPLEPLADTERCRPRLGGPSPDLFYPEYLRKRKIEGVVTLEFKAADDFKLVDVRIVQSSGHVELDNAALDYSWYLRAQTPCVGRPVRIRLRFTAEEKQPSVD